MRATVAYLHGDPAVIARMDDWEPIRPEAVQGALVERRDRLLTLGLAAAGWTGDPSRLQAVCSRRRGGGELAVVIATAPRIVVEESGPDVRPALLMASGSAAPTA